MIPRLLILFVLLVSPWTGLAASDASSLAETWLQETKDIPAANVIPADETATSLSYINQDLVIYGTANGPVSLLHGNLYVVGKVNGPISVVGGNVTVLGEVSGKVSVIGGQLRVAGTINGDTSVVGGSIIRDDKGTIKGNRSAVAGPTPGSTIKKESKMHFKFNGHPMADYYTDGDGSPWVWVVSLCLGLVLMVCWGASSILVTLIAPRALDEAARLFTRSPGRVWAVGVAFWMVFTVASGVALLLSLIYVGVPLLGGLALIYFALRWFGLAALMLWFGRRIWLALRGHEPSLPAALMIGLLALGILHMVPIVGVAIWFVLLIPVAGVAVLWLIEFRASRSIPPAPPAPLETPPNFPPAST